MSFDLQKQATLEKMQTNDKSKAGQVDKPIRELINLINAKRDFYTTSSCSGRILIYQKQENAKKNEVEWLLKSHNQIQPNQVINATKNPKADIWFKCEPVILHIAARNQDAANTLLKIAKESGLKRGGVQSLGEKIILEIQGVDVISTLISKGGNMLVDQEYLKILTNEANLKIERNNQRIQGFQALFGVTFK